MSERCVPPVLVLGVGNDLLGDDAVGWEAAGTVAGWKRPGVTVICTPQLVPELAAAIAAAATVVLIDAQVCGSDSPSLHPVAVESGPGSLSHGTSFPELLALARDLYGTSPAAYSLGIPAFAFAFGAAPSPYARAGIEAALELLAVALPRG